MLVNLCSGLGEGEGGGDDADVVKVFGERGSGEGGGGDGERVSDRLFMNTSS